MDLFRVTRRQMRAALDTSFEPDGDGFLFYRHHWARGIPVSAAEREAYLWPPLDGDRSAFYDAIRGRTASGPRRSYWRSYGRMLAGIPASFGLGLVLLGAMFLWRGWTFDPPLAWLFLAAGGLSAAFGAQVALAGLCRRR